MTSTTQVFDPVKFKQTTQEQWQTAAEAWHRWGPTLSKWLGPATETMLDMAGISEGSKVLDVAAGAGEQTLTTAKRVGSSGSVLATDLSSNILEFAAATASDAGLTNVQTRVLDGEQLDELDEGSFDAVISRVGLIYFPDQQKALRGMLRALKPGGKLAAMTYSIAAKNEFFSLPVSIVRQRAELPPPLPGQPGPFSLGTTEILEATLTKAGFSNVQTQVINAPLLMSDASECVRFEKESFGAMHQMMSGLSQQEQDDTWQEIEKALSQFNTADGFVGPCELIIGAGTKA